MIALAMIAVAFGCLALGIYIGVRASARVVAGTLKNLGFGPSVRAETVHQMLAAGLISRETARKATIHDEH